MIKINDRNINDIFKNVDNIEKHSQVLSVLYAVFLKINDIEKSIESMVRFLEALKGIFLAQSEKNEHDSIVQSMWMSQSAITNPC